MLHFIASVMTRRSGSIQLRIVSKETHMAMTNVDSADRQWAQMKQTRTWAQIARLSADALAALDAGKVKDARGILTAIRGVALNADKEGV